MGRPRPGSPLRSEHGWAAGGGEGDRSRPTARAVRLAPPRGTDRSAAGSLGRSSANGRRGNSLRMPSPGGRRAADCRPERQSVPLGNRGRPLGRVDVPNAAGQDLLIRYITERLPRGAKTYLPAEPLQVAGAVRLRGEPRLKLTPGAGVIHTSHRVSSGHDREVRAAKSMLARTHTFGCGGILNHAGDPLHQSAGHPSHQRTHHGRSDNASDRIHALGRLL